MLATAIISALGLAAAAFAAPQVTNSATPGVYICPRANFVGDAAGGPARCAWYATPGTSCGMLPRFNIAEDAESHISISPDPGNFCTLFESGRCNKTQPYINIKPPGLNDVFQTHKDQNTRTQYKTFICSPNGDGDALNYANI